MTNIIVIPCYNEATRLKEHVFEAFAASHEEIVLLFVNDGSSDGTAEILGRMKRALGGQCEILQLPSNVGKAEAVRLGMLAAIERNCRYVGYWDADLSTPLEAIDQMERILNEYSRTQVVLGSRIKLLGSQRFVEVSYGI